MKRWALLSLLCISCFGTLKSQNQTDSIILQTILLKAGEEGWASWKSGRRMVAIARQFLNTPYVASTLEAPGPEQIRVNFRELDCTTLAENVLALSMLIGERKSGMDDFRHNLTRIRYRSGQLNGYASRLHYSSDWISDNATKGLVRVVDDCACAKPFRPMVWYMSRHPEAYPALMEDTSLIPRIAERENVLRSLTFQYLPKEALTESIPCIQNGDLLFITTNMSGLDFSHVGLAVREKGKVRLLHASSSQKKVVLTQESICDYLAGIKRHTGLVIVRPF